MKTRTILGALTLGLVLGLGGLDAPAQAASWSNSYDRDQLPPRIVNRPAQRPPTVQPPPQAQQPPRRPGATTTERRRDRPSSQPRPTN